MPPKRKLDETSKQVDDNASAPPLQEKEKKEQESVDLDLLEAEFRAEIEKLLEMPKASVVEVIERPPVMRATVDDGKEKEKAVPPQLALVAPTRAKPPGANPHARKAKKLPQSFGGVHDQMHFAPTDLKPKHGVWGTQNIEKVKKWIGLALDSIYANDDYVVSWKAGDKEGQVTYLVNMDKEVGYISGSSIAPGKKPIATHMQLFLAKNGALISAFPCDPSMF